MTYSDRLIIEIEETAGVYEITLRFNAESLEWAGTFTTLEGCGAAIGMEVERCLREAA